MAPRKKLKRGRRAAAKKTEIAEQGGLVGVTEYRARLMTAALGALLQNPGTMGIPGASIAERVVSIVDAIVALESRPPKAADVIADENEIPPPNEITNGSAPANAIA